MINNMFFCDDSAISYNPVFFSNKVRTVQDSVRVRCCSPPMAYRVGQGVSDPC